MRPTILFDVSIPLWGYAFGFIFSTISFIITVLVEAAVMKKHFSDLSFKKCSRYSLFVNFLSSLLGIPIAYLFSNTTSHTFTTFQDFVAGLFMLFAASPLFSPTMIISILGWWLVIAFFITLISEFVFYKWVLKSKSIQKVISFTIISNLASYVVTIVLSFVAPLILFFINQ